ncbi:hypothetical protein DMENIID0001_090050 [Sergentomyia squamirostris]
MLVQKFFKLTACVIYLKKANMCTKGGEGVVPIGDCGVIKLTNVPNGISPALIVDSVNCFISRTVGYEKPL